MKLNFKMKINEAFLPPSWSLSLSKCGEGRGGAGRLILCGVLFGANLNNGGNCALGSANANNGPSNSNVNIGSS